ncbi:molybdopterin-binding protein [Methylobacterium brachythecii]|uniref:DMSO/TMAO reductase YedYZ molybdopterin-dependent catalytic subunit n=1 Tax=Methylobacterium brachythecii TaxID=1176177 RepID=A0A7W6AG30_9HYPH|nr:molybdopterin-binding protein [Methylobacterium brachythecii]MBB3902678.1 DMSO/TMAO reductase YedYZ molybdopterin-dependent catalytic subunit [Methylobacterium brachythecii]GLS42523.1 molybdopterin oxidoreductase [Methylobacterium brachythecii]
MKRRLAIPSPHRRGFLTGVAGLFGTASLGGCDRIAESAWGTRTLKVGEDANLYVQRLLLKPTSMAREFSDADISTWFKPNGTVDPEDKPYKALAANQFSAFKLRVDGLVEHPLELSLEDLRVLPTRTQITRHDCVEGWSAIGKWTGVPLAEVLNKAALKPQARYIVFHCADTMEYASADSADEQTDGDAPTGKPIRYYESIDLTDAFHPQTILAYDMNGKPLPVSNGAPLRLRVERQLGYKQAKYIMRIEVADTLAHVGQGNGGYWEDNGYEWYAGI